MSARAAPVWNAFRRRINVTGIVAARVGAFIAHVREGPTWQGRRTATWAELFI